MKKNDLYALTTVLIWATMAAAVKLILAEIPSLQALAVSSYFGVAFLIILNICNGNIRKLRDYSIRDYATMAGLGFIGVFLYSALYYYGLSQLTSQVACIANYLWPIMLVLFSCVILKEKLTLMKGIAMLCSFAGIVILSLGSGSAAGGNAALGLFSCVLAAACYGLFSVLNKKVNYDQNISMMVVWSVTAVCGSIAGPLVETWTPIRGMQWLGLIWIGVVVHAIAYLLWALALNGAQNTARIANLAFLVPFLSLIVSAIVLGEKIQIQALIALIFIIGGILLQSLYENREPRKP